eukprot:CAMPEP_0185156126 /NCGR_PEP_ID=MMETSP1139-20130426/894_1 /TAXON_ID=298111 /ORGANISM="Pavlova sp., Strain CCMP459" /LENGTH=35 /DNA_ID= /DNA_START= /DNA_END= /DNA_ORIENTATION=
MTAAHPVVRPPPAAIPPVSCHQLRVGVPRRDQPDV